MDPEREERKPGAPPWVVTFADLMSLLLTFFVLLLSFSNTEIIKFRVMAGSVRNALGMKSEFDISDIPTGSKLLPYEDPREGDGKWEQEEKEEMAEKLNEALQEAGLQDQGSVKVTEQGVVLQLSGDVLFESGKADINPKLIPYLDDLAKFISTMPHSVDVMGHTDDVPIATLLYPSNWELSAARAGQTVRFLSERQVAASRLRAIGHAHTVPLAANDTALGRARNRRVEFLFLTKPEAKSILTVDLDSLKTGNQLPGGSRE